MQKFIAMLAFIALGGCSRGLVESSSPKDYYDALSSAQYTVIESTASKKGRIYHRLQVSTDGKAMRTLELPEEELQAYSQEHPAIVRDADAYQTAFAEGQRQGEHNGSSDELSQSFGYATPIVPTPPARFVDTSEHWEKGWLTGYQCGYKRRRWQE